MSGVEIEFSLEDGESGTQDDEGTETEASESRTQAGPTTGGSSRIQGQWHCDSSKQNTKYSLVVPTQIMQLLGQAGLRRIFANHRASGSGITLQLDAGNEVQNDSLGGWRMKGSSNRFPSVPSKEGRKLMDGGTFGSNEYYRDICKKSNTRLARKLMSRELGTCSGQSTTTPSAISQVR